MRGEEVVRRRGRRSCEFDGTGLIYKYIFLINNN